ncbi:response regulator [Larkinella humicola]|uniref:Response regulator transcription factor n=1 Tax=Larkinella humicola TaxID=2607654 RepID=A0A5N1JHM6_9BACT|nr:response regulator transcription factor [Larkinella humicola]KAA9352722.1 response regulator transcription factor [Larkinella humicola]
MKHILIADDHRLFAEGLQFMLTYSEAYQIVGIVCNGKDVLPFLAAHPVDILLLDVQMPGMSGIEVTRQIRPKFPDLPILTVSMQTDYASVRAMFDAGVNGFCLKSAGRDELLQALDRVSQGLVFLSPDLTTVLTRVAPLPATPELIHSLTPRENEIVQLLIEGYSNTDIAEQLFVSPRTVETHRKNIYAKLAIHHITELTTLMLKK